MKRFKNTKYYLTKDGNVFNSKRNTMLKLETINTGYQRVTLCTNNVTKRYLLHRLMANVYLGLDFDSDMVVDHLNRNKQDNRLDNLEVVTSSENCRRSSNLYTDLPSYVTFSKGQGLYLLRYNGSYSMKSKFLDVILGYRETLITTS